MIEYSNTLVMIPTLNEAQTIGRTIEDVQEHLPRCVVVVVDSYSDDGTATVAMELGADVIDAPRGGKGKAIRETLEEILSRYDHRHVIMIDGDYTYPAKHLPELVLALERGTDVAIGRRATREKGAMTDINLVGNVCLSVLASMLYRTIIRDVCTGMWAFRRSVLENMKLTSDKFTLEADMFVNVVKMRYRLEQFPIEYRARPDDSMTKLGLKDGIEIGWFLFKARFS